MNNKFEDPIVEVIVMSRNSPETGLRVFNSIKHYNLNIIRAAFTYSNFNTSLFRSAQGYLELGHLK
nr:5'-nucleotidase [Clostridium beijerinckii]